MATTAVNGFYRYQPYVWGCVSAFCFGLSLRYFQRYQDVRNRCIIASGDLTALDADQQKAMDNEGFQVITNTFLGIASGVQAIPSKFTPKRTAPRYLYMTLRLALLVGFFWIAVPRALEDRTLRHQEIESISEPIDPLTTRTKE